MDRHGSDVRVGTRVRVVALSGPWLGDLAPHEHARVALVLNEVFVVEEIDRYGHPWVTKCWHESDDLYHSHSVALDAAEMEVVEEAHS